MPHATPVIWPPFLATMSHAADVARTEPPIDWPSLIRRHDMTFDKRRERLDRKARTFRQPMVGSMLYPEAQP